MVSVLVADDSPTVRLLLRGWLSEAGFETHEAGDGVATIEQLKTIEGNVVVLLDYQMPKLDGYGVLRQALTEQLTPPKCNFVVISSAAERFPPEFTALLRELRIQIVPKPFDQDTILHVTRFVALRLSHMERA